jgi:hypothetical protein
MTSLPPPLLYALGYVFLLIAALVLVSLAFNRLTREDRQAERARRTRRRSASAETGRSTAGREVRRL